MKQLKTFLGIAILLSIVSFGCKKKTTTPPPDPNKCEDFTDARDGQKYKVVKIGEQCLLAENLNYDTGDSAYCYDDDPKNCDTYGKLYVYSAAAKACPDGWHLPSRTEWEQLIDELGGENVAGSKMKVGGSSGLNFKLGGFKDQDNKYKLLLDGGSWWSTTMATGSNTKNILVIIKNSDKAQVGGTFDYTGNSCRCVKDK
jgi:uncharacterized protein (TIGR02145 family)